MSFPAPETAEKVITMARKAAEEELERLREFAKTYQVPGSQFRSATGRRFQVALASRGMDYPLEWGVVSVSEENKVCPSWYWTQEALFDFLVASQGVINLYADDVTNFYAPILRKLNL